MRKSTNFRFLSGRTSKTGSQCRVGRAWQVAAMQTSYSAGVESEWRDVKMNNDLLTFAETKERWDISIERRDLTNPQPSCLSTVSAKPWHHAETASVVLAQLSLKAVGKAQLFMALAFQNWSLSHAHRLSLGSGCGLWGKKNLSGDFHAQKKKDQVTSLKDNDMIIFIYAYLTHFHTFIWILKASFLVLQYKSILVLNKKLINWQTWSQATS